MTLFNNFFGKKEKEKNLGGGKMSKEEKGKFGLIVKDSTGYIKGEETLSIIVVIDPEKKGGIKLGLKRRFYRIGGEKKPSKVNLDKEEVNIVIRGAEITKEEIEAAHLVFSKIEKFVEPFSNSWRESIKL